MSQPTPYARQFDFTGWSTSRPNTPHPGVQIDAELNAVRAALNHALTNLALIQRDDTGLANGVVGIDQLSAVVQAMLAGGGFTVRGNWAASTAYLRGDVVADDGKVYLVITDHNSSASLPADIASGYVSSAIFEPHALLDYMDDLAAATGAGLVGSTGGITVQAALDLKAALASPTFTGTPAAPTAALGTDTTQIATTAFVQDAVQALLDAAPGTLDTLNELAAALGDDANFATTTATALAGKAALADLSASGGSALIGFLQAGTGAVARTVQAKLRDTVSVMDFGAVGDGVTNDRAAIAAAVAAARGKALIFPEGNYLIDTDGGSITLEEVTLQGEGVLDGATGSIDQGAVLHFTGTTNSPFKVRRGTTVEGLGFYYPNQTDSASPTAYPPIFAFDFTNGAVQFVFIRDNVAFNAYKFADIDDSAGGVGHVWIEDNAICALNRGIYLRRNLEHLRICGNNFTFGHWLAATEAGARAYVRANAIYIEVAESDGVEIFDNLFFGSLNAIKTSGTGLCQFMLIEQNKFDQVRRGVLATGSGRFDGSIINNTFNCFNGQDTTLQGRSIDIQTTGAGKESISITANSFLLATEDHIFVSGNTPTRDILIGPNNYRLWAAYKAAGAYGAINAGGANTNITVSGGWFVGTDYSAYANGIMGSPNVFQCTGATFNACLAATNVTTNTAILTGNVSYSTNGATSDVLTATNAWQTGNKWDKPSTTSTKPAFLVRKSASQTFNSGTLTDAVWGNEVTDKGGNFASNVFTAPLAGRYRFEWSLMHDNTGVAGDRWVIVLLTSAGNFSRSYQMIADYNSVSGSAMVELATSGTAKIQVQRVGGAGNFVTHNDGDYNYFSGALIE